VVASKGAANVEAHGVHLTILQGAAIGLEEGASTLNAVDALLGELEVVLEALDNHPLKGLDGLRLLNAESSAELAPGGEDGAAHCVLVGGLC
jgi:hypothetical protein